MLQGPGDAKRSGQGMIRAYALNLSILSFAALFVGMFLVYSLVALNAASRRSELAILRSLGASSRILFWLFIAEGAFFGLLGWLLALPIGSFLTRFLLEGVSRTVTNLFVRVTVTDMALSPWEIVFSLGVTIGVAVLAAVLPAREAMRIAPKEVMAASPGRKSGKITTRHLALAGLVCVLAVVPLAGMPGYKGIPLPGYLATLLLFVGFALMAPWGLQGAGRRLQPILRRRAGLPAHLAAGYIQDSGSRTAVSVGALVTAVALFTALVIMVQSFRHTVEIWVEQTISGDLFVTTRMAEINRVWEPLPVGVATYLKGLDEVDLVPNRRFTLSYEGFPFTLEAMDFAAFGRYGDFFWLEGDSPQLMAPLAAGKGRDRIGSVCQPDRNVRRRSLSHPGSGGAPGLADSGHRPGLPHPGRGGVLRPGRSPTAWQRHGLGGCPHFFEGSRRSARPGHRPPAGRSASAFRRPAGYAGRA